MKIRDASCFSPDGKLRLSQLLLFLVLPCSSIPASHELSKMESTTINGSSVSPASTEDDITDAMENGTGLFPYALGDNVMFWESPEDMLNPSKRNPAFYPILITHIITFLLGILGNLVTAYVMVGDRKSRSATMLFLVRWGGILFIPPECLKLHKIIFDQKKLQSSLTFVFTGLPFFVTVCPCQICSCWYSASRSIFSSISSSLRITGCSAKAPGTPSSYPLPRLFSISVLSALKGTIFFLQKILKP